MWTSPALMRPFVGAIYSVRYSPSGPTCQAKYNGNGNGAWTLLSFPAGDGPIGQPLFYWKA